MKHSIRHQMMAAFILVLGVMSAGILICNAFLLESYYIRDKKSQIIHMYQELSESGEKGDLDKPDEQLYEELVRKSEKDNLFFLVVNMESGTVFTNVQHMTELKRYLDAFLLNQTEAGEKILESTDSYEISQTRGRELGTEYLMMRGTLDGGYFFLIQSPLESIQGSVELANRFLVIVGIIAVIIGMGLVYFFSKRLSEPLLELAEISGKMAELNFEAKYTSGGENEIGILGENFNRMSEKLEQTISELKNANNRLLQDLEQRDKQEKMRSEFLGNVSHELKTPIALIQGYAEGLKEDVNTDAESREFYCDVIIDETSKMNHMVKSLLTLNQLESGEEQVEFERFNLTEMVRGILQGMEIFAEQAGAKVQFLQKEAVYVWADEYKAEQVVRNYLGNAFHHVSGEKIIEIKIEQDGNVARTTVFNTGKSIPEEDLVHIWDKFYKVDKAHTREYGGNGIGLSIVKAVMESLHQKYGVENYDNGVAFWFELGIK